MTPSLRRLGCGPLHATYGRCSVPTIDVRLATDESLQVYVLIIGLNFISSRPRKWLGSGLRTYYKWPIHIIMRPRISQLIIESPSDVLYTLTRVWLHSDSNASSRQRQTSHSRVLSEANTIIDPFDSDTAQIRDMRMNRLIFFSSPDLKFAVSPESKRDPQKLFAYLPGLVDLKQHTETYLYIFYFNITNLHTLVTHAIQRFFLQ